MFKVIIHGKIEKGLGGSAITMIVEPQIDLDDSTLEEKMACSEIVMLNSEWLKHKATKGDNIELKMETGSCEDRSHIDNFYKEEKKKDD